MSQVRSFHVISIVIECNLNISTVFLGFTVLNNAYALNGTIYIVQADENPAKFPERYMMISDGSPRLDAQPARDRGPTDKNMRIVNVTEARGIFGRFANRMEGTSVSRARLDCFVVAQLCLLARNCACLQFICYDDVKCEWRQNRLVLVKDASGRALPGTAADTCSSAVKLSASSQQRWAVSWTCKTVRSIRRAIPFR